MRLLVTRPEHEFDALAAWLKIKGHTAIRAPLLVIKTLAFDLPDPAACDGLVLTSANAVRALAGRSGLKNYTGLATIAVGIATSEAARAAGFTSVISSAADVDELGALLGRLFGGQSAKLWHLAGVERAGDLGAMMGAGGPEIKTIEVYEAAAVRVLPDPVVTDIRDAKVDGCILMSPRTAAIYTALVLKAGLVVPAQAVDYFCLSPNVALKLDPLGLEPDRIRVSPAPDLDTLLSLF